jgi:hypothetical protein
VAFTPMINEHPFRKYYIILKVTEGFVIAHAHRFLLLWRYALRHCGLEEVIFDSAQDNVSSHNSASARYDSRQHLHQKI